MDAHYKRNKITPIDVMAEVRNWAVRDKEYRSLEVEKAKAAAMVVETAKEAKEKLTIQVIHQNTNFIFNIQKVGDI